MSESSSPAKHTPGPWISRRSGRVEFAEPAAVIEVPDHVIRIFHDELGRRVTQFIATCAGATLDNAANARLIAAAPELLEACKLLIDAPHQEHFAVRLNDAEMAGIEAIKAAIAKAERVTGPESAPSTLSPQGTT